MKESINKVETEKCECCEKEIDIRHLKMTDDGIWFCKNCIDINDNSTVIHRKSELEKNVHDSNKFYTCSNCQHQNIFKRKAYKPASEKIVGYCKNCGHVVWYP